MKTFYCIFVFLIPILLWAEPHDSASQKTRPISPEQPGIIEDETILTNAIRDVLKEHGQAMRGEFTPQLCKITRKQNEVMESSGVFAHDLSNYGYSYAKKDSQTKALSGGIGYAENIAKHLNRGRTLEEKARECAVMWWNSSGHRRNMLAANGNYCHSMRVVGNQAWCTSGFSSGIPTTPLEESEKSTKEKTEQVSQPTPPSPLLPYNADESQEAENRFPNLRLSPNNKQIHGKTTSGQIVPIHFHPTTSLPIGGARGEHTLTSDTIDDLYHFYKERPKPATDPRVQKFMQWAEKPSAQAEVWPNWECKDAPVAKGLSPITKSSFEITMNYTSGEKNVCTANIVSKQKIADGSCEFGLASAAHCMIPNDEAKKNNFKNNFITKLETRFGVIPVQGSLDFPSGYAGWFNNGTSAKNDISLIRFRSSCDTVDDAKVLKIADNLPPYGAQVYLAKRNETFTGGSVSSTEDKNGDVVAQLKGTLGQAGDSGGAILHQGQFVGVLGRATHWLPVGPGVPEEKTYFNNVIFYKQATNWLKRTLASCYGPQKNPVIQNRKPALEIKPQPKPKPEPVVTPSPNVSTAQHPISSNLEWRADGMWGKDVSGNTVPLVFSNQTGELLGGERGELKIPDTTKKELYDYVKAHPDRFSDVEKTQLQPFMRYWEGKLSPEQSAKTKPFIPEIPKQTDPKQTQVETTVKTDFECVRSENGFRPRYLKTAANGARFKALGAYPMATQEECTKAVVNSRNNVVCSYTGIGYKPTHFSGRTAQRPDHGYFGTSIKSLDLCLKATLNSTANEVCHWNDGNWIIANIHSKTQSRGDYRSLDACLQGLGVKQAPQQAIKNTPPPQVVRPLPEKKFEAQFKSPHDGIYGNYCASCHNDQKAKSFPGWVLDKDKLNEALASSDPALKSFAQTWTNKLHKYLVENNSMPPKEGTSKALHAQAQADQSMQDLKTFLTNHRTKEDAPITRAPNAVQIVNNTYDAAYRRLLPNVQDEEIQRVLKDPNTIFYDQASLPAAYQDDSNPVIGVRTTEHGTFVRGAPFRDERTGKLKVFSHGVGLDPNSQTKTYHFLSLPKGADGKLQKIKLWAENKGQSISNASLWNWDFPVGTVSGEVVYQTDSSGHSKVLEVRTRKKEAPGSVWEPDIFVATPTKSDLLNKLEEIKVSKPVLKQEAEHVQQQLQSGKIIPTQVSSRGYRIAGIGSQGYTEELPPMSEALANEILSTTFKSSRGAVWDSEGNQSAAAPTTKQKFGIVPQHSTLGAVPVNTQSCNNCHDKTNFPIRNLYGKNTSDIENLLNNTTVLYGNTPGSNGQLRWHPFDPSRLPDFSQVNDNRRIRREFIPIIEVVRK